jgi:hypothetical protein
MPHLLLHVETIDGMAEDHEGLWFPDIATAQKEAVAVVRELLPEKSGRHQLLPEAIVIAELSGNSAAD